jgi:hypothetical protein
MSKNPPENTCETPILAGAQSRLLKATLAVYRAEHAVEEALDELARVPDSFIVAARFRWLQAETKLDLALAKRKAVIARIARDDAERDGRPWLSVARSVVAA